jgi:hypothetical protein
MMTDTRSGGCSCGAVRYTVTGEPTVVGICHCTLCRKETGSVFMAYADWPLAAFTTTGAVKTFEGRSFCPDCGSRLFSLNDDAVEIKIGTIDEAPTGLIPNEENLGLAPRKMAAGYTRRGTAREGPAEGSGPTAGRLIRGRQLAQLGGGATIAGGKRIPGRFRFPPHP